MVIIKVNDDKQFYINKLLKLNFDIALEAMKDYNQDLVLIVDGEEGSGKSQASRQLAFYCSQYLGSKFDLDSAANVYHDIDKYIEDSGKGEEFRVQILDESREALNRKRSMSKKAVKFTNYLSECRQKKQVHIIILPAFHDLDSYVVKWRMKFLVHMIKYYKEVKGKLPKLQLGSYKMFGNDGYLRKCYDNKYYYPKKYEVYDRFSNVECFNYMGLKDYDDRKISTMVERYDDSIIDLDRKIKERRANIQRMMDRDMNVKDMSIYLGVSDQTIRDDKRAMEAARLEPKIKIKLPNLS